MLFRSIESGIVEYLGIARPVRRASGMEMPRLDREVDARSAGAGDGEPRLEQAVDRGRGVERFERTEMRILARRRFRRHRGLHWRCGAHRARRATDLKSGVSGQSGSVRVDLGVRRVNKKTTRE